MATLFVRLGGDAATILEANDFELMELWLTKGEEWGASLEKQHESGVRLTQEQLTVVRICGQAAMLSNAVLTSMIRMAATSEKRSNLLRSLVIHTVVSSWGKLLSRGN